MSGKGRPDGPKFGLMDRLKRTDTPDAPPTERPAEMSAHEPAEVEEVKFTSYLRADLNRRLQIHVVNKKARKKAGQERVSIKSVLQRALEEYLERHGE